MVSSTPTSHGEAFGELWSCDTLAKAEEYLTKRDGNHVIMKNFIGNNYISQSSDAWVEAFDPKTGKLYGKMPVTSPAEVETAVDAATEAFKTWSKTSRVVRSKYLRRIADLIQEHHELFAVWESIDQGKTLSRARVEVDRAISNFTCVSYSMTGDGAFC
jgi:acyl-CoA reductase-like NAD-dependent aldehyde dehydrogenase